MSSTAESLAAVRGLTVGHATGAGTGCTVILAPPGGVRAACAVRGHASGTRELDALGPGHLAGHVDAVLLTGGSAYGLGAADGVMRWLRARGRGFPVGPAGVVPIVPAAVVFDLPAGGEPRWPTAADAERACDAASTTIAEGSVGAGTGATVGKVRGREAAMKGGLGTWAARAGDIVVGVLVVLNAFGDVRGAGGEIIAGARGPDGRFVDAVRYLAEGGAPFGSLGAAPPPNTTLGVVATNAALDKVGLVALAQAAGDALARRITPFGTLFDGDVMFALSTAERPPVTALQAEALAAQAVPVAVERAVRLANR
jgi:L-aminopeptidase/D-esterase-like protein